MIRSSTSFMSSPCLTCLGGDGIRGSPTAFCSIALWISGGKGHTLVPAGSPCRFPMLCPAAWRPVSDATAQSSKSVLILP